MLVSSWPRMYTTLSTLTVIRNASPLVLLAAEHFMFGVTITRDATVSLAMILLGWAQSKLEGLVSAASTVFRWTASRLIFTSCFRCDHLLLWRHLIKGQSEVTWGDHRVFVVTLAVTCVRDGHGRNCNIQCLCKKMCKTQTTRWSSVQFGWVQEAIGILFVVLDAFIVCFDRLAQRYLLQEIYGPCLVYMRV